MGIEKKNLSVRVDHYVLEELKHLAESENRSLSNYVETILKQFIEENKKETN